jgi:uncharacterized protein
VKRFLFSLMLAGAAGAAFAQSTQTIAPMMLESITVRGTGQSTVTPDRFTFTLGVQTVAPTVETAVNQNNQKVASVLAALKKAGAAESDIQTSQFNIYPQQDYQEGKLPRILGYQVNNSITVRSMKVGDAGKLLGVAVGAGVNTSSGINFEVSDPARGRDQALRAALEDARAKAMSLAQAAGRTLGRTLQIVEGGTTTPPPYAMPRAMAMEGRIAGDVPVEAGTQEVSFSITATFELR